MTTTKPDVDLAGIRKIVEAPFDHEQYVSNNLWLVEQVPALLDLVDAQKAEIAALEARAFAHAGREERMRKALVAIPLTTQSCHGRGGWLVCTGCGERANMLNDIPHKHDCYVPLVRAALADQPASPAPVTETNDV